MLSNFLPLAELPDVAEAHFRLRGVLTCEYSLLQLLALLITKRPRTNLSVSLSADDEGLHRILREDARVRHTLTEEIEHAERTINPGSHRLI